MMRFLFFLLALITLAQPCEAALAITGLGKAQGNPNAGKQMSVFTGADCPVGSLIVIFNVTAATASDVFSFSDEVSNTYAAPFDSQANSAGVVSTIWGYAAHTTHDLPSGDTVTVTYTGTGNVETIIVSCITGAASSSPLDVSGPTANGGATTATSGTTVNSGTLAQANEIVLGGAGYGTASGTVTCNGASGSNWTKPETQASGTPSGTMCSNIVASTSSIGFGPSWATASTWLFSVVSFKQAASVGGSKNGLLMGVLP